MSKDALTKMAHSAEGDRAARGDVLSCYTTSIAEYFDRVAIDRDVALASQLFLATKEEAYGELSGLAFVHHHSPLVGNIDALEVSFALRRTESGDDARAGILDELRRAGLVIVVGDVHELEWQVGYQKVHAPHWFLIDAIDEAADRFYAVDMFEFINELGTQARFEGWLPTSALTRVALASPEARFAHIARDRHALGLLSWPSEARGGWQWLSGSERPRHVEIPRRDLVALLARSCSFHGGLRRRSDLTEAGWTTGLQSLLFLAEWAADHLDDERLYDAQEDFWVVARNRQMFLRWLDRLGRGLEVPAFSEIAEWATRVLMRSWEAIPRLLQYGRMALRRGKVPQPLAVELLRTLHRDEGILVARLHETIALHRPDLLD